MNRSIFVLLLSFCGLTSVAPHPAVAELVGSINADQKIVLRGSGETVVAMDFFSEAGLLLPILDASPAPWGAMLSNSRERVAFGSFQGLVVIDGEVTTKVGYSGSNPASELEAIWTDPSATVFDLTFQNPGSATPLSGFVNAGGKIVLRGTGQQVVALNFESPRGLLIPVNEDADSIFEFAVINNPTNVAIGNFGKSVTVDGEVITPVGYRGNDPENELTAEWGDAANILRQFEVSRPDIAPLSGYVNARGKIVLQGNGHEVVALDFHSPKGLLVPVPEGNNDSVFEFSVSNVPTRISIGNLGKAIKVDGELVTDVGYLGSQPENELSAQWGDSFSVLRDFVVTRPDISLDCNGDGTVNSKDLTCVCSSGAPLQDLLTSLNLPLADIDASGEVAFIDFLILARNYGEMGDYSDGDINCSGEVEFLDFLELASNFGRRSAAAAAVPEPGGVSLVLLGLIAALWLRRRIRIA